MACSSGTRLPSIPDASTARCHASPAVGRIESNDQRRVFTGDRAHPAFGACRDLGAEPRRRVERTAVESGQERLGDVGRGSDPRRRRGDLDAARAVAADGVDHPGEGRSGERAGVHARIQREHRSGHHDRHRLEPFRVDERRRPSHGVRAVRLPACCGCGGGELATTGPSRHGQSARPPRSRPDRANGRSARCRRRPGRRPPQPAIRGLRRPGSRPPRRSRPSGAAPLRAWSTPSPALRRRRGVRVLRRRRRPACSAPPPTRRPSRAPTTPGARRPPARPVRFAMRASRKLRSTAVAGRPIAAPVASCTGSAVRRDHAEASSRRSDSRSATTCARSSPVRERARSRCSSASWSSRSNVVAPRLRVRPQHLQLLGCGVTVSFGADVHVELPAARRGRCGGRAHAAHPVGHGQDATAGVVVRYRSAHLSPLPGASGSHRARPTKKNGAWRLPASPGRTSVVEPAVPSLPGTPEDGRRPPVYALVGGSSTHPARVGASPGRRSVPSAGPVTWHPSGRPWTRPNNPSPRTPTGSSSYEPPRFSWNSGGRSAGARGLPRRSASASTARSRMCSALT